MGRHRFFFPSIFESRNPAGKGGALNINLNEMEVPEVKVREQVIFDKTQPLFTAAKTQAATRAESWLDSRLARMRREGPFGEVGDLTPELAELLLKRNPANRTIKQKKVVEMQRDILEGNFPFNGEAVIVADTGDLNDGQHRCLAVLGSGRTISVMFSFGAPRESRTTVDTGIARTPGDMLSMRGMRDANNVAAVAAALWQVAQYGELPKLATNTNLRPTKQQVQDTAEHFIDEIERGLFAVPAKGSSRIASKSALATAHVLICRAVGEPAPADYFIAKIVEGSELNSRDPIFVGRDRLIEEKRKRHLWPHKTLEILLRAWNMHRRGLRTGKIQLMESWPRIAG